MENEDEDDSKISLEDPKNNKEVIMNAVCRIVLLGAILSSIVSVALFFKPKTISQATMLSKKNVSAMEFAEPYLVARTLSVLPSVISNISSASFRGTFDFYAPFHVTLFTSIIDILSHPMIMFKCNLGVKGAVVSTLMSECMSAIIYLRTLKQRNMISLPKLFQTPNWKNMYTLIKGVLHYNYVMYQ